MKSATGSALPNQFLFDRNDVFESEGALIAYKKSLITRSKIVDLLAENDFLTVLEIFKNLFSEAGLQAWQEGWVSLDLILFNEAGSQNLTLLLSRAGQEAIRDERIVLVKSTTEQPSLQPWQISSLEVLKASSYGCIRQELLELFLLPNTKIAMEKNLIPRNSCLWQGRFSKALSAVLLSDEALLALEEKCFSLDDLNLSGCSAEVLQVLLTEAGKQALKNDYITIGLALRFDPAILTLLISPDGITAKQEKLITFNGILNHFSDPEMVKLIISPLGRFVVKNKLLTIAEILNLKLTPDKLALMLSPPGLVALSKGMLKSKIMTSPEIEFAIFHIECQQIRDTAKPADLHLPLHPPHFQTRLLFIENIIKKELIELFSIEHSIYNLRLIETLDMYINSNRFYAYYFPEHVSLYTKFEAADLLMQYLEMAYLAFSQSGKVKGFNEDNNIEVCKATLVDLLNQYLQDPAITIENLQIIKKRLIDQDISLLKTPTPTSFLSSLFFKPQDSLAHLNQAIAMISAAEMNLLASVKYV